MAGAAAAWPLFVLTWHGCGPLPLPRRRPEPVQLVARHWVVEDEQGKTIIEVPRGSRGVLGCTPLLKPDTCFQYYSGLDLENSAARMGGCFQMAVLDAKSQPAREFDALIAPFAFVAPPGVSGP